MNYIVLDLEWNQCAEGKEFENSRMPFEIIEIGAVKLDENRNEISRFSQIIKPQVYKEIHEKTQKVINLSKQELEKGKGFVETITSFLDWCGKDFIFCTWGAMDLTELQRNLKYYNVNYNFTLPLKYYNVQKLFSMQYEKKEEIRTLEYAVEKLNIEKSEQFHSAVADAYYTGLVFKEIKSQLMVNNYSIDYYKCPREKKDEIYIDNGIRLKYVSRGFEKKEDVMLDKTVTRINCNICKKALKKKIKWFTSNSKIYYCACKCEKHGYVRGKIRIKKTDEGEYFAIRTSKLIDEAKFYDITVTRDEIREKRKQKKKRNK